MPVPTLGDKKLAWLKRQVGVTGSTVQDCEFSYYSGLSGLTPVNKFTAADHKRAYLAAQPGVTGKTLADLEFSFLGTKGFTQPTLSDRLFAFYT